ncbi:MAG: sulfite exporter TauE/SafE family protein [Verrucomicrobia bacterium]|nr:sulfite exporter TauE/SafE family protein [Verrucomicrobiota bacterium]
MQSITTALEAASTGPLALPLAFALGSASAVGSACCTLPAMGMLVAYSGTRENMSRRAAIGSAISFMLGTSVALIVLGFVAGFVGQSAQALLGSYWKLFAGVIAVVFGLAALGLLPLKLPQLRRQTTPSAAGQGMLGTLVVGLLLGGGVAACSLPCNPGIFVVLGAAVLQGHAGWGMLLMAAFALGFSLPLAAILLGVSFGKASIKAQQVEAAIRIAAGVLLAGVGLYLLATF